MAIITESFNKADNGLGPDLTWVELAATAPDWEVNTNEARRDDVDGLVRVAVANHDLDSADHYAQVEVTKFNDNSQANRAVAMVRIPSVHAETGYQARVDREDGVYNIRIDRMEAGSRTTIAGPTVITPTLPFILRCEAEGTTIRALIDGVERASVVDAVISGNLQTGIASNVRILDDIRVDNFEAGDLAAPLGPHVFFDITDLPADFGNAETGTITVRTRGVDILTPSVVGSATSSDADTESTNHTVNLPASIETGDKLVVLFSNDDTDTPTFPAGWDLVDSAALAGADSQRLSIYERTADGTEGASITVTTTSSELASAICYRIANGGTVEAATIAEQNTDAPNPPSLSPAGGSQTYVWIAVAAQGARDMTVSAYPTNYGNNLYAESGSGGLFSAHGNVAAATRVLAAASEDPATFTQSLTHPTLVTTLAVAPKGLKLFAQVFQSDETTTLSDEVEVVSHSSDSAFANSAPVTFTGLNTTANKAVWDAARIRFRWGT